MEDLKGLKLRVIPNPMFMESFSALGANPVPMAFPELYGALESKAMDAQENPFSVVLTSKFFEVQKFLSVTNHVYTANPVVISRKTWDKLAPADQKLVKEAVQEAGAFQRKLSRDASAGARKELESQDAGQRCAAGDAGEDARTDQARGREVRGIVRPGRREGVSRRTREGPGDGPVKLRARVAC